MVDAVGRDAATVARHMTLDSPEGAVRQDTVLVVDDEPDIRESVAQILESTLGGVEVATAADGDEALKRLAEGDVDVVIADFRMPGMDGLELLKQVSERWPDVPRILMTAYGDLDVAVEAINAAHVHSFFRKPFDPEEVVGVLWEVLDEHWETIQKEETRSKSLDSLRGDERRKHNGHPHS